jgi:hypothetical protein
MRSVCRSLHTKRSCQCNLASCHRTHIYIPSLPKLAHKTISTLHFSKQLLERQLRSILISYEHKEQLGKQPLGRAGHARSRPKPDTKRKETKKCPHRTGATRHCHVMLTVPRHPTHAIQRRLQNCTTAPSTSRHLMRLQELLAPTQ